MNSLRALGDFVGLGDGTPARADGGETNRGVITMRSIGSRVSVFSDAQRASLRAMLAGVAGLPPISLEIDPVGETAGEVGLPARIRVHPSGGAVVSTELNVFDGAGRVIFGGGATQGNGRDVLGVDLGDPGRFSCVVTRIGVQSSGVAVLSRAIGYDVRPRPLPTPPPPPPQHQPSQGPTCRVELDLGNPGAAGFTNMRVFGGGFLGGQSGEMVEILDGESLSTTTAADALGLYSVSVGFPHANVPTVHVLHARGLSSGLVSGTVSFTV